MTATGFDPVMESPADIVRSALLSHAGQVVSEASLLGMMPALGISKAREQLRQAVRDLRRECEPVQQFGTGYVYLLSGQSPAVPSYAADFVESLKDRAVPQGDLFGEARP